MSREIKFRAWDKQWGKMLLPEEWRMPSIQLDGSLHDDFGEPLVGNDYILEQYTGLKDKNGKEIYENCELDGRYRVEYIAPKFVGKDMIKGDIIELYDNKFTITKEHCEISQNSERGTN